MKKLIKFCQFLFACILVTSLISSCDEDDPKVLPESAFTYLPTTVVQWDEVTFTNTTTYGETYAWDFGDGNTSTEESPKHTYTTSGSFTVTLTTTNSDGDNVISETIDVAEHINTCTIDGTEYDIINAYEYVSGMTGVKEWRMKTEAFSAATGDDPVNLLKFSPKLGTGVLEGDYTFDASDEPPVGTFEYGFTANYAGMQYDSTAIGFNGTLEITKINDDIYKFNLENGTLKVGAFNFMTGEFNPNGTELEYTVDYIGEISPAVK